MNAKERLELIRAKLRKPAAGTYVAGGVSVVQTGQPPRKKARYIRRPAIRAYRAPFGVILPGPTEHTAEWIHQPDERAERERGFRHDEHWLTRVAERLKRG